MEAGVEHLGRATSASVNALLIVVNPGARSRNAAAKIRKLGQDLGIKRVMILANRVRNEKDMAIIKNDLSDYEILGFIPEMEDVADADREGVRPYENIDDAPKELSEIAQKLLDLSSSSENK